MTPQMIMPQPVQLRFTVDDYHKMIELGMLKDYEQAEIIEGRLIKKMTVGDRHAAVVNTLNKFLVRSVPDSVLVSIQNPIRLGDYNEPEPDVVLADLTKYDGKRHPQPTEILLVIEVSDTTVKYDREVKLPLYAEAEIQEVWVINLPKDIVEVHRKPTVGLYQTVEIYKRGDQLQPASLPDLSMSVDEILG